MKVHELIEALQALGIEKQDLPVTFVRDDFPRNIQSLQEEHATKTSDGDHWWISYAPVLDAQDGEIIEKIEKIIVLRQSPKPKGGWR